MEDQKQLELAEASKVVLQSQIDRMSADKQKNVDLNSLYGALAELEEKMKILTAKLSQSTIPTAF